MKGEIPQVPRLVVSLAAGFVATGIKMVCIWLALTSLVIAAIVGRIFTVAGPVLLKIAISLPPAIKIP